MPFEAHRAYAAQEYQEAILVGFSFQTCITKCALVLLASYEWCILEKILKVGLSNLRKKGGVITPSAY